LAQAENNSGSSPWALTLITIREIPVRVHLTFFLLLLYVAFVDQRSGGSAIDRLIFVILLFGCVLLHELGHALMASVYHIRTRDIVLYPFGGVATLLREGKPKEEFFIALAGPLVNLVLAAICGSVAGVDLTASPGSIEGLLGFLCIANLALALFNMIPALPMDGGRVLRAALALIGVRKATAIAVRLSQVLCVVMAFIAIMSNDVILMLISFIIFSHSVQEHMRERTRGAAIGFKVRDVMTDASLLQTFLHGTTVSQALKVALKSLQSTFPVVLGSEVIGIIDREAMLEVGALDADDSYISGHMQREFPKVGPDQDLSSVLELFNQAGSDTLVVLDGEKLAGLLFKEKVLEYLLVQEFRKKSQAESRRAEEDDFPE
jgi:Zn-dependent protease/CBS domain-containing protein